MLYATISNGLATDPFAQDHLNAIPQVERLAERIQFGRRHLTLGAAAIA